MGTINSFMDIAGSNAATDESGTAIKHAEAESKKANHDLADAFYEQASMLAINLRKASERKILLLKNIEEAHLRIVKCVSAAQSISKDSPKWGEIQSEIDAAKAEYENQKSIWEKFTIEEGEYIEMLFGGVDLDASEKASLLSLFTYRFEDESLPSSGMIKHFIDSGFPDDIRAFSQGYADAARPSQVPAAQMEENDTAKKSQQIASVVKASDISRLATLNQQLSEIVNALGAVVDRIETVLNRIESLIVEAVKIETPEPQINKTPEPPKGLSLADIPDIPIVSTVANAYSAEFSEATEDKLPPAPDMGADGLGKSLFDGMIDDDDPADNESTPAVAP